jgi:DNA-directed RNA polymerase subunit RPC12/RpoP
MIVEIAASIAAAKNVIDLLQSALSAKGGKVDLEEVRKAQSVVFDLHSQLVKAQESASLYEQTISDLKHQIVQLQDWKEEAKKYQLTEFTPGAFAYVLKPGDQTAEPPHYLCATCFTKGQKSILQRTGKNNPLYECHVCGSKITLPSGRR